MEWSGKDNDRFLDLVLAGHLPQRICDELGCTKIEAKNHFEEAFYNPDYKPSMPRIWRGGTKKTELETRLISNFSKRRYPVEVIAKILQRKPDEISKDEEGRKKIIRLQEIAPISDVLMAHHYLYHCSTPVISDQAYDTAKKEELEFGGAADVIRWLDRSPKQVTDYPPHIRSLAHYIQFKNMDAHNCVDYAKLPMYFAPEGHWKTGKERR